MRKINVKQIFQGWTNEIADWFDLLDEDIKEEATRRISICMTCPLRTNGVCDSSKSIVIDNVEYFGCGCNLAAKSKCPDCECPANFWENESTN